MRRILISAAGTMASVSYIRHLQSEGFYVIGINASNESVGSLVCDEFHVVPLVSDTDAYIETIEKLNFDVFMPWLDEEHILFARKEVSFYDKILTSPASSIEIATDKLKTYDFCLQNSIAVSPKTDVVPAFVRSSFSRGSKGAKLVVSQEELDTIDRMNHIIQRPVQGVEYTVDILCGRNGEFIAAVPRKRLVAANVSTLSEIDMDHEIIEFCRQVCGKLVFCGPINIQLFKTKDSLVLVEINPRLAGTSILSIHAGFDLLVNSVKEFLGEIIEHNYIIADKQRMYRVYEELYC